MYYVAEHNSIAYCSLTGIRNLLGFVKRNVYLPSRLQIIEPCSGVRKLVSVILGHIICSLSISIFTIENSTSVLTVKCHSSICESFVQALKNIQYKLELKKKFSHY